MKQILRKTPLMAGLLIVLTIVLYTCGGGGGMGGYGGSATATVILGYACVIAPPSE